MSQTMMAVWCAGHCCSFVTTRNVPLSSTRERSVIASSFSLVLPAGGRSRRIVAGVRSKARRMKHLVANAGCRAGSPCQTTPNVRRCLHPVKEKLEFCRASSARDGFDQTRERKRISANLPGFPADDSGEAEAPAELLVEEVHLVAQIPCENDYRKYFAKQPEWKFSFPLVRLWQGVSSLRSAAKSY